jgi:hypothetical protein
MNDGVRGLFSRLGRKEPAAAAVTERVRIVNPYHAVSIVVGPKACAVAQSCAGIRFLSREAPRLPLRDCDCADCRCRYAHHDDRRIRTRRIADGRDAQPNRPYDGPERRLRSSSGRRDRD